MNVSEELTDLNYKGIMTRKKKFTLHHNPLQEELTDLNYKGIMTLADLDFFAEAEVIELTDLNYKGIMTCSAQHTSFLSLRR